MHALLTILAVTSTTTGKSSSKGSSSYIFLFVLVGFALLYFLFLRPRQQRMRQQQGVGRQIGVGDQVISAGGIHGRVVALDADVAEVEVAPGVVLTFLRRAINPRPDVPASSAPAPIDDDWPINQAPAVDPGDTDPPADQTDPHS
jgi:preprotein translocase subunit YajC